MWQHHYHGGRHHHRRRHHHGGSGHHRDHGARVMIAPTHVLEPDVPFANILALVEEAKSIRF